MRHGLRKLERHPGTITRVGSTTLVNKERALIRILGSDLGPIQAAVAVIKLPHHGVAPLVIIWACGSANCNNATNLSRPGNHIDGAR